MPTTRFNRLSLRSQIALVAGALAVMVSAGLTYVTTYTVTDRIRNEATASLQVVSLHAARLLSTGLNQRARQVKVLADAETIWENGLDSPGVHNLIERTQLLNPYYRWIGVTELSGVVKNASGDLLLGKNVSASPWFTGGQREVYVGDVHSAQLLAALLIPSATGEPLRFLDFAAPIRVQGQVVGVFAFHVGWEWAADTLALALPEQSADSGIELFLFDRQGDLIFAPNGQTDALRKSGQRLPILIDDDGRKSLSRGAGGHVVRWDNKVEYLTTITRLPPSSAGADLGWYVVARESTKIAFAQVKNATRDTLILGILAALVASLVGWFGARRLSADLKEITIFARKVEHDDRSAAIPLLHSSHEVHLLSTSLHSMTARLLAMHDGMQSLVTVLTRDLETANRALDQLAHSDTLTGLFNRRGFDIHLEREMAVARRTKRPLSLVMVDADHFKYINDTFGRDVGDDVLRMLSKTIRLRLRDSDVAGRYGGEEFMALLPDTDAAGAANVAQQLVHSVAAQYGAVYGNITISAGVATMSAAGESAGDLLRRADTALYAAKQAGRNRISQASATPDSAVADQPPLNSPAS